MSQLRQSLQYANYLKKNGWIVEPVLESNIFIKQLSPFGSVMKFQRPVNLSYEHIKFIHNISKKYRSFQIIIEPDINSEIKLLEDNKFRLSKSPYLPTKTLKLKLDQNKDNLFFNLKKDARHSIKINKELKIYSLDKTPGFVKSWKRAVGIHRHVPSQKSLNILLDSFKEDCLFLVTPCGESGAIFLKAGNTAYYWQAFTDKVGRKNMYQYKILWAGISWAILKDCEFFDFEGIYDERFPNKTWLGFSHFKKSFGGFEVDYPGAFTKLRLPV